MKRISIIVLALLLAVAPARARNIAKVAITTAVTAQTTAPFQFAKGVPPGGVSIMIKVAYGSGGTTIAAWVQTSLDGGATWADVAAIAAVTTASVTSVFNVSTLTPKLTPIVLTDGSLAAGTAIDGIVGPLWRVKYTTTGTYAGTTLTAELNGAALTN